MSSEVRCLSSHIFSPEEEYLLGLGAKFRITSQGLSSTVFAQDLTKFTNKVRWYESIHNGPTTTPCNRSYIPKFHTATGRKAPIASPAVKTLLLELKIEGSRILQNLQRRPYNLSEPQLNTLKKLKNDPSIIITNADKGLGTVVLDTKNYTAEGDRLLTDESTYRKVPLLSPQDLENDISHQLSAILKRHKDHIDVKDLRSFLSCFPFKPAKFYLLPKLHKTFITEGQPKCRPIVSSIGYCTSPASRYVDFHLKKYSNKAETVLSNSSQVIDQLRQQPSFQDCVLLTADVESLYTNMCWKRTIDALQVFLEEVQHPQTSFLIDLVNFILTNNYFVFQNNTYHQIKGMAMGTPMAVNVANLFLFIHERSALRSFRHSVKYFGRYVDDIQFLIHNSCDLAALKTHLYADLPEINLTWSDAAQDCVFLDLHLSVHNNSLDFHTYQKPQNAYLYIPFPSDHPRSCFRAFIKAELLRFKLLEPTAIYHSLLTYEICFGHGFAVGVIPRLFSL